jgi:hypothetical protein
MVFKCTQIPAADVNATRLSVAKICEPTSSTEWTIQQPNEITSYSADITKVARNPISVDRVARKGTVTNLESAPAFQHDITLDAIEYWADGFLYSKWRGLGATDLSVADVAADGYVVVANGALPQGTLVYATGFNETANNGLKTVGAASTATKVVVAGLTVETDVPVTARLHAVGRTAAVGDVSIDANGDLITTDLDLTTLGLVKGQYIYLSGFTQTVTSKLARVGDVTENAIVLQNSEFVTEAGTGKTVSIYISQFVRNVDVGSADYVKQDYTMEARYNTDPVIYEYARGVAANQMTINAPLNDKMTTDLTFVAQDMEEPVTVALPGIGYTNYIDSEAYNTVTNLNRVRLSDIDDNGLSTYLKDTTVTINNNVAGENVLGIEGAAFTNLGNLDITLDTETVMTNGAVLAAIRNNISVNFELAGKNGEGMFVLNLPSLTLGDGGKNLTAGEKIKVTVTGTAYQETELGYVIGISLFKYIP